MIQFFLVGPSREALELQWDVKNFLEEVVGGGYLQHRSWSQGQILIVVELFNSISQY